LFPISGREFLPRKIELRDSIDGKVIATFLLLCRGEEIADKANPDNVYPERCAGRTYAPGSCCATISGIPILLK